MDTGASASFDRFADAAWFSNYAATAMQWTVGAKVLNSRITFEIEPQDMATRAEVAQILVNFNSLN